MIDLVYLSTSCATVVNEMSKMNHQTTKCETVTVPTQLEYVTVEYYGNTCVHHS